MRLNLMLVFTFIVSMVLPLFYLVYYRFRHKRIWFSITGALILLTAAYVIKSNFISNINILLFFSLTITLVINLLALKWKRKNTGPSLFIILIVLAVFSNFANSSYISFLTITSIPIVLVMLISLIQEMKVNRAQSIAAVRLESELLKRNLQPHFLMNSLMLVIELIEQRPDAAPIFVQALAEEMKILIKFSSLSEVSLEEEITLCRRHIEIMAYRYNADYLLDIRGDTEGIIIPPAIIHTQIVNAFSHNYIANDSLFILSIRREGINIELELTSPINIKSKVDSLGIGERYVYSRLKEKFGYDFSYESYSIKSSWVNKITFKGTT